MNQVKCNRLRGIFTYVTESIENLDKDKMLFSDCLENEEKDIMNLLACKQILFYAIDRVNDLKKEIYTVKEK